MQNQKRNELVSPTTEGGFYRTTTTTTTSTTNGTNGPIGSGNGGKVRQLFEERRQQQRGIGIDKSYPLQPIGRRMSPLENSRTTQKTTPPFSTSSTRTVTRPLPGGAGHQRTTTHTVTTMSKYGANGDSINNNHATEFGDHPSRNGLSGKLASLSISSSSEINNNHGHPTTTGSIKLKPVNLSSPSTRTVIKNEAARRTTTSLNNNGELANDSTKTTTHSSISPSTVVQRRIVSSPMKTTTTTTVVKSATKTAPKVLPIKRISHLFFPLSLSV